jgi:hypothetical protein
MPSEIFAGGRRKEDFVSITRKTKFNVKREPTLKRVKSAGPIITCECGMKILLLPDLRATSEAIENHVAEHQKQDKDLARATAEAKRLRDDLIGQALKKIGGSRV